MSDWFKERIKKHEPSSVFEFSRENALNPPSESIGVSLVVLKEIIEHFSLQDEVPKILHTVFKDIAPRVVLITMHSSEYDEETGVTILQAHRIASKLANHYPYKVCICSDGERKGRHWPTFTLECTHLTKVKKVA
jgi:hypothetical protein